jgi:hypothetical protein
MDHVRISSKWAEIDRQAFKPERAWLDGVRERAFKDGRAGARARLARSQGLVMTGERNLVEVTGEHHSTRRQYERQAEPKDAVRIAAWNGQNAAENQRRPVSVVLQLPG